MVEGAGMVAAAVLGVGLLSALATVLSRRTATDVDGNVVPADVQALADAAGVGVVVYALARVAASEAGGQKRIAKEGVLFVVMNEADRRGVSALDVVLGSASAFGHQGTGGRGFVSSAKDPGSIDLDVADQVASGVVDDPTDGALNFDSPRSYEDPARADLFAANRASEHKVLVVLDGVPESTFRFWRPA